MLDWHLRHGFCSQCGSPPAWPKRAISGFATIAGPSFSRTDPVVIMLATHEDACLVGRQKGWPDGMFSSLAGFMEPGETIEEAVAREMQEEAGIEINRVRYFGTQPWPFPASMMIGCLAEAAGRDITLDDEELEEARWISREDVRRAMNGDGPSGCRHAWRLRIN